MNKYFFKITNTNNDKNKLYTAMRQFVEEFDNSLIKNEASCTKFRRLLNRKVEEFNELHKRCQPIEIRESIPEKDGSFSIRVENSWYATFYIVKQEIQ